MRIYRIMVPLRASPAQRPRATRGGIIYADPKTRDWQEQFRTLVYQQLKAPLIDTAVGLNVNIFSPRDPAKLNSGDIDNVLKNIMDALTKVAYTDDRIVVKTNIAVFKHTKDIIAVDVWEIDTNDWSTYIAPPMITHTLSAITTNVSYQTGAFTLD